MHGAQRKHIFFAGVRKRIGHMSMHDQSATLTVAFSLLAASRCLEEQQTDGATALGVTPLPEAGNPVQVGHAAHD